MKKQAFTLAEVLITLAIIGVVAALTLPALTGSFQSQKIGPSIRKMMNTMETANQHIMADNEVDSLSAITMDRDEYMALLSKYIKGAPDPQGHKATDLAIQPTNYAGGKDHGPCDTRYGNDGFKIFNFASGDDIMLAVATPENLATSKGTARGAYKGVYASFWYDLNGTSAKPNKAGVDMFYFKIDDNGTVIPDGGRQQYSAYVNNNIEEQTWKSSSWNRCDATRVDVGNSCSGSIADNNWKVIYSKASTNRSNNNLNNQNNQNNVLNN